MACALEQRRHRRVQHPKVGEKQLGFLADLGIPRRNSKIGRQNLRCLSTQIPPRASFGDFLAAWGSILASAVYFLVTGRAFLVAGADLLITGPDFLVS